MRLQFRISRLRVQNPDTRDTTQEPSGKGVSHAVLVSIQTGWTNKGKVCNRGDGWYADAETKITGDIYNFIVREIKKLQKFSDIYNPDENSIKIQHQETSSLVAQYKNNNLVHMINSHICYLGPKYHKKTSRHPPESRS